MELTAHDKAKDAIKAISKAAAIHAVVTNEIEEGLTPELEELAIAIQKHYELEDTVMEEYRAEVSEAIEKEKADDIPHQEIEGAVDVIYEMCNHLKSPRKIMRHVFNAREIMYLCGMIA